MPSSRSAADLDAVTVDAFGTLVRLRDPSDRLREALLAHGVERGHDAVGAAFKAEAAYYRPRSLEGRDEAGLADLRRRCAQVFLDHLDVGLDAAAFAPAFVASLDFQLTAGAAETLAELRAAGLALACVANWDVSLTEHLERLGVARCFAVILPSASAGVEKPDPAIFRAALGRLGVDPARALHIGDEEADRVGALAAGLSFEPAPLATLPVRIGLR